MEPEHSTTTDAPANPEVSFEPTDAYWTPVASIGIGIIVLGIIAHFVCLWVFDAFRISPEFSGPVLPPLAAEARPKTSLQVREQIPPPRLEHNAAVTLDEFRRRENAVLDSHGKADPKTGTVQIPISEAMRLMANPKFAKEHGIRVEQAKDKGAKQ
jgi:hypothetical protein